MPADPPESQPPKGVIASIVKAFLDTRLSVLLVLVALALGAAAILVTPREEEPQIVVPLADVMVSVPGASAEEVEKLVTTPLERLLWQIDGVEYVYSQSRRDSAVATVRFFVGQDRERSLIKLYNAISMHQDLAPDIVSGWLVKPVEIDDVPIVAVALYSDRYGPHELRRMAEELMARLSELENISGIDIYGGQPREIRVELDPQRLAGYGLAPLDVQRALAGADISVTAGTMVRSNTTMTVRADSFLTCAREAAELVVGVRDGRPIHLNDVAEVMDTATEADTYSRIGFSSRLARDHGLDPGASFPAVTLAIAKKRGTNAVDVAQAVRAKMDELQSLLPFGVSARITRDYGATAQDKVSNLLNSLFFAILTVVLLLAVVLGKREAAVVALAVPISFALCLFASHLMGYTINRVTLFALILSLGLVVDDPITNVDNIQRHILARKRSPMAATLYAVAEVLPPVIMSTLAIIICFVPLFFITGMMGPYMAPMAANVPLTVSFSTLAALTIVPWMSFHLLKHLGQGDAKADSPTGTVPPWLAQRYRALIEPMLVSPRRRLGLWLVILVLLAASVALPMLRLVPLKMLPFDNKNEFQVVVDMPEGTPLEATDRAVRRFEDFLRRVPEVTDFTSFVGTASPMDFNGMVRHYYMRDAPNLADLRVNLVHRDERTAQSHAIVLRLRPDLERIAATTGATIKIVEVPPGPPVLSTVTGEIYGTPDRTYSQIVAGAMQVLTVMHDEPFVADIDSSAQAPHDSLQFVLDKEKAALHGVSAQDVAESLAIAVDGHTPANIHMPGERNPLPVRIVLPRAKRSSRAALSQLAVRGTGGMVQIAELGSFSLVSEDQPIMHKNLRRVVYVYAEMAGRAPGEAILDMQNAIRADPLPPGISVDWAGEGEWKITLRTFRDMGIAFAAALLGIYVLLVIQTRSWAMPALVMSAIPLTVIGIMPGFWLLNVFSSPVGAFDNPVFFTATAMIGMIALGGIVIRNSLVLMEFIQDARDNQGLPLQEAILQSGVVRLRPIVLTALTTALGAWPITLDPIFSGLAWALIFGLLASTAFTLIVVPVAAKAFFRE